MTKKYAVEGLDGYPNELAHKIDDALELNAALVEALEAIEWYYAGDDAEGHPYMICPRCENRLGLGHKKDCGTKQALAEQTKHE